MRLLIDANLSPLVAARLRAVGHDAVHVGDCGLLTASDDKILSAAAEEGRTIVSADADFGTLLALGGHDQPSVILLRSADQLAPADQARLLAANLPSVNDDLLRGAIVTFARGRARVRPLPITKSDPDAGSCLPGS